MYIVFEKESTSASHRVGVRRIDIDSSIIVNLDISLLLLFDFEENNYEN